MATTIQVTLVSHDRNSRDYEGTAGGTTFRVQIREDASPHWYGMEPDDDTKSEILDAIDVL